MDLPADNRRIPAEPALEEIPRKHHGVSVWTIFTLGESTSDRRLHAQQRKQVPAAAARDHQFRQLSALPGHVEMRPTPHRHAFKAVRLRAPVEVVGRRYGVVVEPFPVAAGITAMLKEHNQVAGIVKGEWPKQHRAYNGEERGSCADA
jgi:hypothetical protein